MPSFGMPLIKSYLFPFGKNIFTFTMLAASSFIQLSASSVAIEKISDPVVRIFLQF